jgi:putative ABC transport system substrate-binding protein
MTVADPVGTGLAASLERPGGNVTGVIQQPLEFNIDRLRFLKEAVPSATRVAVLVSQVGATGPSLAAMKEAAPLLGIELVSFTINAPQDLAPSFDAATAESAGAVMVLADTVFTANRAQIVRLADEHRLPALYPSRLFLDEGGLMDYAYVEAARGEAAAEYITRILQGADPGDLPMQPPSQLELAINLKAAERIGYVVPQTVLGRATDVLR